MCVAARIALCGSVEIVISIAFSEEEVCGQKFLRDFTAACRKMSGLVELTTGAQVYLLLTVGTLRTYRTAKQTMNAIVAPTLYSIPHVTASAKASHNWREADELLEIPIPTLATSRTAKTSSAMPVTTTINLSKALMLHAPFPAWLAQRAPEG